MNFFTFSPLHLLTAALLLLAALVLWRCAREAARTLDQARELRAFAESRFLAAQGVFRVARADREIAIAANAEACRRQRNVQVDEHIVSELVRAREALEALRGYEPVLVFPQKGCAQGVHVLYVPHGFPVEQLLPGAQRGRTN